MINEPLGWTMDCDNFFCQAHYDAGGENPVDEECFDEWAKEDGWIVAVDRFRRFCSLDCLLVYRRSAHNRKMLANYAKNHARRHIRRCCRYHGIHASNGTEHSTNCPKYPMSHRVPANRRSTDV